MININDYEKMIVDLINEEGVYPMPGIYETKTGKIEILSFACSAQEMLNAVERRCERGDVSEFVIGLDTYNRPGQGTTLDSSVIIFHVSKDLGASVGVLEYSWNNGEPKHKAIDWENYFWMYQYSALATSLVDKL
jgi:hypothetical protein